MTADQRGDVDEDADDTEEDEDEDEDGRTPCGYRIQDMVQSHANREKGHSPVPLCLWLLGEGAAPTGDLRKRKESPREVASATGLDLVGKSGLLDCSGGYLLINKLVSVSSIPYCSILANNSVVSKIIKIPTTIVQGPAFGPQIQACSATVCVIASVRIGRGQQKR